MSHSQLQTQAKTIYLTPGPNDQPNPPRPPPLAEQLMSIPRDTNILVIDNETPSDEEWALLSNHFTDVKDLTLCSGWNEYLNDNIPLHWPLERLVINSPAGELARSPFIIEGRVKHLRFEYAMGLRFEGPGNEELIKEYEERIARGEEEEITTKDGVKITYLPGLVKRWLGEKYGVSPDEEGREPPEEQRQGQTEAANVTNPKLETLEIIENDVHDTLIRMSLSISRVFTNVKTLHLRATNACDFHYGEDVLHQIFPQLTGLKTLKFTLGSEYSDPKLLTELYRRLPPNLETLQFRGPAQLAKSKNWSEWVAAFQNPEFLPHLQRLSFLLDLSLTQSSALSLERKERENQEGGPEDPKEPGTSSETTTNEAISERSTDEEKYSVSTEDLRIAKRACEQIWKAAEERNIVVESFKEEFPEHYPCQKPFDDRWESL
ncbi:hypothetical protein PHISCL_02258 [Aspergillus sclerotialis]|uniref:Uncharacterized protein n=1 Tax=Aspergillus sclerotialis TaxID=2070753 RepID=A0A3A2ZVF4_9EURO|nr:hypothetical protein PHISCL_02258 [Aspergillus sclerotialis]